jgi:TolB-like protein
MIGETLLHYEILSRLGKGGMGEVFLARDTRLQRQVALKVLPEAVAGQPRRWERFVREARAVAALNHPNIVTIYSVEEAGGRHFFTMELVSGKTLDQLIEPGGMALERFFAIALPMIEALAAAHRQGIIHRDFKPENVMMSAEGRVKVLDFGMAKPAPGVVWGDGSLTEEGSVVGTARYMSPEQARSEEVDHRCDVFSLGIVLYEMATGCYPFQGRTSLEVLSSILRDMPPPPEAVRRTLPTRLGAVIHRCLQKHPEDRQQTADEVKAELVEAQREALALGIVADPDRTQAEPFRRGPGGVPAAASPLVSAGERPRGVTISRVPATPALAVLPLTDLSGQPDYFVDGLTEELITSVAKIGSLRVISRQSVMRYRGSTKLLPEIAKEIGVDHVLEGSVLRSGERVRISLQLIRADPEEHLWAERYDRLLGDVFSIQSEVARAVAAEIEIKLTPHDEVRLANARPVAAEVYEVYLQGRYHWNKRTPESLEKALYCFQAAVDADAEHAPSYAGLADTWALLAQRQGAWDLALRAKAAARRALELDPDLAEAHTSLAFLTFYYDWEFAAAERSLRRALELAPNLANAHHWYWSLLMATGRHGEARHEIQRAVELDPLAPIIVTNYGVHHYFRADYARAERQYRTALELEPGFYPAHLCMWRLLERQDHLPAAAEHLAAAARSVGREDVASATMSRLAEAGYGPAMELAGDMLAAGKHPLPPETTAWLYLANGRRDRALDFLHEAFAKRAPVMVWLRVAPEWDPLRAEPRFRELVELVGLPAG